MEFPSEIWHEIVSYCKIRPEQCNDYFEVNKYYYKSLLWEINLYNYALNKQFKIEQSNNKHIQKLQKMVFNNTKKTPELNILCSQLYNKGYCGLDLIKLYETMKPEELNVSYSKKYENLILFHQLKKEFRHEELCMLTLLNYILIRFDEPLEI